MFSDIWKQMRLLREIEKTLEIPVVAVANKCDLPDFHGEWEYQISTATGDGVDDVVGRLVEVIGTEIEKEEAS